MEPMEKLNSQLICHSGISSYLKGFTALPRTQEPNLWGILTRVLWFLGQCVQDSTTVVITTFDDMKCGAIWP